MIRTAVVVLCLALGAPAWGETLDLQQLLFGREYSASLKLKDLNAEWRRVSLGTAEEAKSGKNEMLSQLMQMGMMSEQAKGKGKPDPAAAALGMSFLGALFGGGGGEREAPVYYTKGQTLTVGGETFLIAYRSRRAGTNFLQMAMEAEAKGREPDFAQLSGAGKLTPDTPLSLSLVNVKSIAAIDDIRPFDLNQEIAESASSGSGGLLELIAQQAAKEAAEGAKPALAPRPVPATKPAAKPKPAR
jgi:hypothetical protein